MGGLEFMIDQDINDEVSASLASLSTFFPSLKTLDLINCPNQKGWWRMDIVNNCNEATRHQQYHQVITMSNTYSYHPFHVFFIFISRISLRWLACCYFQILKGFTWLIATWSHWNKQLRWKMNRIGRAFSFLSFSSSSPPLSKLKVLDLSAMHDLESLPEEWFKNLTSLEELVIWSCPNLTSSRKDESPHLFMNPKYLQLSLIRALRIS